MKCVFIATLALAISVAAKKSDKYTSLTVRIGDNVPTDRCNRTLENIQALLTETSRNVFTFTNGLVLLKDISIQLPLSWEAESCAPPTARITNLGDQTDINVTPDHPLLGENP